MIIRQFITDLSTKYQTTETNIAREYCQHIFLSYLYKKSGSDKLLFKGGTALRIIFNSPRFSEDLDFSSSNLSIDEINSLIDNVLKDIKNEGILCDKIVNPGTQGETSKCYFCIVKLKFLDFNSEIRLQVSFRDSEVLNNSTLIQNEFLPAYTIIYLSENILVKEKINALLDRAKPRDFFDLYFILRNPKLVKFLPKDINGLKNKIMSILVNGWEKELKVFLPISYHSLLNDFKERLISEIETHIS